MSAYVHIASFILQAVPEWVPAIVPRLSLPEVEVVTAQESKIVVLIEASDERRIVEIADAVRELPGVLSVTLVEHHRETAAALQEEISR